MSIMSIVKVVSSSVHSIIEDGIVGSLKSDVVFDKNGLCAAEIDLWFSDNYGVEFLDVGKEVPVWGMYFNVLPITASCIKVPFVNKGMLMAPNVTCVFIRAHELGHLVNDGEYNVLSGNVHKSWSLITRVLANRWIAGITRTSPLCLAAGAAVLAEEFRASAYAVKCIRELRPNDAGLSGVMLSLAWMSYFHAMKKVFFV